MTATPARGVRQLLTGVPLLFDIRTAGQRIESEETAAGVLALQRMRPINWYDDLLDVVTGANYAITAVGAICDRVANRSGMQITAGIMVTARLEKRTMRIAVTGATGFIGRYLVRQLTAKAHTCRCWYRSASDRTGLDDVTPHVEWLPGVLGDPAATAALVDGCEAVVHGALYHPGGGFRGGEGNLLEFVETNVVGTLRLIEASRAAGVGRFVFISTCAVHERILADRPLDENHPTLPTSHYGAHKAAIEQFVHSFGWGQNYAICGLRPTGVYGLAHPASESKWFDLVRAIVRGEDVICQRGGKEVHAADVGRAVELLLTAPQPQIAGEVFNCYDRYISEFEVATLAKQLSGSRSQILGQPSSPKNQIMTDKLQGLGMKFGGQPLLEATVRQLVAAAQ
jgi:nucleoside-diphosphate-sugar epimerase